MAAGRLDVLLGLNAAEFTSGLTKAEYEAKKFQESMTRGAKVVAAAFGTAVIAGAVALGREIAQMVTHLDDLDESAQALQTTAVALAEMRTAAGEAGVGTEKLDASLTKLNVKIGEAAQGGNDAARLFQAMGVSITDAAGKTRSTEAVLGDVADQFARLKEGPEKAALAVQLFGKAGAAMIPYLNQGAEGLRRFSGLSEDTVSAAARLQSEVDKLSASWQQFKYVIAGEVIPWLNQLIDRFKAVDLGAAFEAFKNADLGQGAKAFFDTIRKQAESADAKTRQLNDALALSAGAYSNEGRSAAQSAGDILRNADAAKAAADAKAKAAAAAQKHAEALEREAAAIRSRNINQDFADAARIRANRQRGQEQLDDEDREAELRRQESYLRDYARARSEAFGEGFVEEASKASEAARELGLVMTSALSDFIKNPTDIRGFFDALMQDILQLTTQLLILKPLMEGIEASFGGPQASSSGGQQIAGWLNAAKGWLADLGSSFVGSFAVGTPYVPADGLAMVHRGERIVTAAENRDGGGRAIFNITNQWAPGTTRETAAQAGAAFANKLNAWNRRNN